MGAFRHSAEKLGRKVMRLDAGLRANNDQPLDKISQFADISRPGIANKNFGSGIAELTQFLSVGGTEFPQEIPGQRGDVLLAVAQSRHVKGNHVQAVEKILAKCSARNFLLQVFVRCGDDAHVDAQGFVGAHALEALFLKHAQNFRLRAQAHVADFIEKERTAVGFLKFADFVFCRTGKAALDVAEELRFDQLLGNRGAINFHERAFAAKARGMQGARNKFLARAAFTIDKDAAVGRRGDGDLLA